MTLSLTLFDNTTTGLMIICYFVMGACCGSFANATALRLVQGEAVVTPPSRCRFCARHLRPIELMPLISWLRQAGNCACGKYRLARRYIYVEFCLATIFVLYAVTLPAALASGFAIASVLVTIIGLTDYDSLQLHPVVVLCLAIIGMVYALAGHGQMIVWPVTYTDALMGAICGGVAPWVINQIYRYFPGQNGLGAGDIWLLAAMGIWLGPLAGWLLLMLASTAGAICGLIMMMTGRAALSSKLPFGCFIAASFLLFPFYQQGLF